MRRAVFTVLIAFAYTAVYGRHGLNGQDDGFILGLVYRIRLGQIPYEDFLYIRPPGSLLLHALPMAWIPANYEVLFERFLFYLFVAVSCHLSTAVLERHFDLAQLRLSPWVLTPLFVAFSVQSFPPMPWHTTDGIALSSVGIFLIGCARAAWGVPVAAVAFCLAALCKQSFLFMPLAGLLYAGALHGRRLAAAFAAAAGGTLGLFVLWAAHLGVLDEFARQASAGTSPGSLLFAGFVSYFAGYSRLVVPGVLAWVVLDRMSAGMRGTSVRLHWLPYCVAGSVFLGSMLHFLHKKSFEAPWLNHPAFLFVLTAAALLYGLAGRTASWTLGLMLGLSWCASLSWGYPTPVLYSAPLLFGGLLVASRWLRASLGPLSLCLLGMALAVQAVAYQFPYMDAPRARLRFDLGEVFPKLSGIRSSEANHAKHAELRALHARFGDRFTVLPGMPLAHYLTDTVPVLGVDWARNAECGDGTRGLVRTLESADAPVFLERGSALVCRGGPACSDVAAHVQERWNRVHEGGFFDVYRRPPGSTGDF